jgi:hypothetical protein
MIRHATYVRKTGLFMLAIFVGLAASIGIGWCWLWMEL